MHAFDILGDPVRRRIVELLGDGDRTAGEVTATVMTEFGITQPAVSRHLRVLRESGWATSTPEGQVRRYRLEPGPLAEADAWLARYRRLWTQGLDALDTEVHRGRHRAERPAADRRPPPSKETR